MSYVVPKEVDQTEFNNFLNGYFRESVLEFNGACGKSLESVENLDDAITAILNESKRVIEESNETIQAYLQRDRTERLDGIVDVYWTQTQLTHLFVGSAEKFGRAEFGNALSKLDYDEQQMLKYARGIAPLALELGIGKIISGKAIVVSAMRIIKNNRMKYTTDKAVAEDWGNHIAEEYQGKHAIKSYMYNGVEYFCIKRLEDDYIVKPYNFKPVALGDL